MRRSLNPFDEIKADKAHLIRAIRQVLKLADKYSSLDGNQVAAILTAGLQKSRP